MAKKAKATDLDLLLQKMREQGLPAQQGGFTVEAIPSGIASFDLSTGVGGVPRQRISVFQGEEASGKTLLLLMLIASVQKAGGRAAVVDLEHALTPSFAELFEVSYDDLVVSRPRTLNQAYDVARYLVSSGLFDVVGFDSAVALATVEDLARSAADGAKRAAQAQVHSEELKKMTSSLPDRTAFVIVNQLREDPSPPSWWPKGVKKLYSPGGRAIRHHASLVVEVRATKTYKDGKGIRVGHKTRTKCVKNKVAQPYQVAEFDLMYATGIDLTTTILDTAVQLEIITKSSSWYYFNEVDEDGTVVEEHKWNGRDAMIESFRTVDGLQESLQHMITDSGARVWEEEESHNDNGWDNVHD